MYMKNLTYFCSLEVTPFHYYCKLPALKTLLVLLWYLVLVLDYQRNVLGWKLSLTLKHYLLSVSARQVNATLYTPNKPTKLPNGLCFCTRGQFGPGGTVCPTRQQCLSTPGGAVCGENKRRGTETYQWANSKAGNSRTFFVTFLQWT